MSKSYTSRPRARIWWLLGLLVASVAIQSITFTPGVRLRYVSVDTGIPIEGLVVVAVWQLRAGNVAGSLGAGVLRVHTTSTDQQGDVRIGAAVMVHAPVFPFSPLYREIRYLPVVLADDERYESNVAASGLRPSPESVPKAVLSYQRAALDGEILRLSRSGNPASAYHREMVSQRIQQAYFACRQSWVCREVRS